MGKRLILPWGKRNNFKERPIGGASRLKKIEKTCTGKNFLLSSWHIQRTLDIRLESAGLFKKPYMKKFVAYFRVSTSEQGKSGLGLEAQRTMVENYIGNNDGVLLNQFTEIETGTSKRRRTEIYKAIEFAKQNNAVLVIAKIDRLARNVFFVSSLMEAGVEFVACDLPQATNFTIHLYAALAEMEGKLISERTKNALAEKKRRGCKLGTPENLTDEAKEKGIKVIKEKAASNKANVQATALIVEYRGKGLSYDKIADALNQLNFGTSQGKKHNSTSVKRLYDRAVTTLNVV
ncbi:recombinase family protein [Flavobacterium sp.]|uniref:recombinase family protein n=1 Tax=Flavobacterium sp. TaxID=239 RepID=UPI004033CC48